jgi:hypothetical protein
MEKIKEFNGEILKDIKKELTDVLSEFGKKYGMTLGITEISYGTNNFEAKLECFISDSGRPINEIKWGEAFKIHHKNYSLNLSDLYQTINVNGELAEIIGIRVNNKYPVIIKYIDSGKYAGLPEIYVRKLLGTPYIESVTENKKYDILNDNEKFVYDHINSLLSTCEDYKCTMDEIVKTFGGEMKEASIRVYVGNLRKKGLVHRGKDKMITIT